MTAPDVLRERIRQRLAAEVGRIEKEAPFTVALSYPSPYAAGMSSLGYQRIYRAIMEAPGLGCERVFLDDEAEGTASEQGRPVSYESRRFLGDFPVIAFSVAYELEIAGVVALMDAAKIPVLRAERDDTHPFVLMGGPLTFSNPLPLAGLADAIVIGEAEELVPEVLRVLEATPKRADRLAALAKIPHVFVPEEHGAILPTVAKVDDALIPAWAPIRTPHAVLSDMFLLETERGCSRGCTYCVMRRTTNGGMRVVPKETVLAAVPADARRVGLVGAAVSDHPRIVVEAADHLLLEVVERNAPLRDVHPGLTEHPPIVFVRAEAVVHPLEHRLEHRRVVQVDPKGEGLLPRPGERPELGIVIAREVLR